MARGHAQEPGRGGAVRRRRSDGQRCARHGRDLANPLYSKPVKSVDGRGRQAKGRYRQFGDRCRHAARHDDALGAVPSDRPCVPGVSATAARALTPARRSRRVRSLRSASSPPKGGRTGDLNPNTIGPVGRDKRAIAHTPCREPGQPFVVVLGVASAIWSSGTSACACAIVRPGRRPRASAASSAAAMIRRGPSFMAVTSGLSRGGASLAFFR